jgi:hypothetical protein
MVILRLFKLSFVVVESSYNKRGVHFHYWSNLGTLTNHNRITLKRVRKNISLNK